MVAAATGIPRLPIAAAQERGPPVEWQRGRDALPRVRIPFAAAQERGPTKCAGGFATASFVYFVYFVVDKESDGGATIGNRTRLCARDVCQSI